MTKDYDSPKPAILSRQRAHLETNPHLFRQLLDASGVAMAVRNTGLYPLFFNRAFAQFYGYEFEEIHDHPMHQVLPAETASLYESEVIPALHAHKSWEGEYVIRTKGGRKRPVWGRFDPVLDESGELTHIVSIMRDVSEARQLRNALSQAERYLHFLAENISDCLFRLRLSDGKYDYLSPAVEVITGYPPADFYNTPRFMERLAGEEWRALFDVWWNQLLGGTTLNEYEFPIRHRDGSTRWLSHRITLIRDDTGVPAAIEGVITDVTARKEAETKLATARKSLQFINESTSDIFFRMSVPDGVYEYLSPSVERFSGYSLQDYGENPLLISEIIHEDWREYFRETWGEICNGVIRPEYEFQYTHKNGDVRWARQRVILIRDKKGNPAAIEGIVTDATAHKQAEEALRESEHKYRLLAENVTDVVWLQDAHASFTYVTPSGESLWGYTLEELRNLDYRVLFTPRSLEIVKIQNQRRKALEARGIYNSTHRMELELVRKDGTTVWAESMVSRLLSPEGKPEGFLGVTRDISDRKQAELDLQASERRFRTLFEDSPISLWEEDLTRLKAYFDELKDSGVTDFRDFFTNHPEALGKCATLVDVVDVNRATLELLGAGSREELLGNLDRVLTESSMAAFTEEMILLASGGFEYRGEITHRTLLGDTIWVAVHFAVPPEYQDTLSRVIVSLIDVTPRKRAEQALMESEERYRALVENSQEGVVVLVRSKPVFINEAMTHILGYDLDGLSRINPYEILHPEDREPVASQLGDYATGERAEGIATGRVLTRNGQEKWITLIVKPIVWNGREAQLVILSDISAHKLLEEELRAAHRDMERRVAQRTVELSEANIKLQEEVAEREKAQERILALTKDILSVQEAERQRIARDLHDNVAQDLSSIVLKLETLFDGHDGLDPELHSRGESAAQVVKKAIAAVRGIAYGLRPPALDQLGLTRALENYCQEISGRSGVLIDFFSTGIESGTLDSDAEINIYRMLQEGLNNVAKHAGAGKVTVRMVKSHPDIILRIEDDGRGFDMTSRLAEAAEEKRMGIRSMEERARLLGGSLEIQSLVGKGTRIIFTVPLEHARRQ